VLTLRDFGMDDQVIDGDGFITATADSRPPGIRLRSGFHVFGGSLLKRMPRNLQADGSRAEDGAPVIA